MAHQQTRHRSHAEFRHRSQIPLPEGQDVEQPLMDALHPSLLAPRQLERPDPRQPQRLIRMRQRLLTRPVMVAIIVSLVWRRVPSVAEIQQVLAREGVWGGAPLRVSAQAISTRLDVLPAAVMGQLLVEVCTRLQAQPPPPLPHPSGATGRAHFTRLAMVDGSTLEALRQKTEVLRQREGLVLAGKVMVMVEAFRHRPLWQLYPEEAAAHDQRCAVELLAALPVGGLLIFDLGCFSFRWFDALTDQQKYFVTRLREKTAYHPVPVLSQGPYDRDERLAGGQDRANPCQQSLRMISVRWQGTWSRDLTTVLAPQEWSARQVCELSRRRWRIEDTFALTKRLLDVASVWTGSTTAVPLQRYATLIFSAVRLTICLQVAEVLGEPLARISVEMVVRAFSHDSRAVPRVACDDLVMFLVEHATLLGMVKRWRKQHRERRQLESIMWGDPSVETGGVAPPVLPPPRAYGSVHGGSRGPLPRAKWIEPAQQPPLGPSPGGHGCVPGGGPSVPPGPAAGGGGLACTRRVDTQGHQLAVTGLGGAPLLPEDGPEPAAPPWLQDREGVWHRSAPTGADPAAGKRVHLPDDLAEVSSPPLGCALT